MFQGTREKGLIPLGLFDLFEPIASGGMGEVWRGEHRGQSTPVAVKVITSKMALDPELGRAFDREVEAVAGLDHPGIVTVLDRGQISSDAAGGSQGRLIAGSPYLVMELATDGFRPEQERDFEQVRAVLLSILDALAHAHARGVVHLDLKPANILRFHSGYEDRSLKLADFGIAWIFGRGAANAGGTPRYMAPEQIGGNWRDYGPWTDLYALGCLAWRLVGGGHAFPAKSPLDVLRAKLRDTPGEFRSICAVPDGFEAWLRSLLERNPNRRTQRAADAAWGLRQLGAVSDWAPTPPLPESWAQPRADSAVLHGAGLALYGLRRPLMVGRVAERDALWSSLSSVVGEVRAQAVVIRGSAGTGKTRLAQWLCERAHELGVATILRAEHGEQGAWRDGLAPMVSRHLKCTELSRLEVAARVAHVVAPEDPETVGALTEFIAPLRRNESPGGVPVVRLKSPSERVEVVAGLIRQLARQRPVIVWLDDVQWGVESMLLVDAVLEGDVPVLFVLTVKDEAIAGLPQARRRLGELASRSEVNVLSVAPLSSGERGELLRDLLHLEPVLAEHVQARTTGVPLFAVQLVGDWVQRGILELGATGFRLRDGAKAQVPDAIHGMWMERLRHLLEDRESDRGALELAAVLGTAVDGAEWTATCGEAGVAVPTDLVDLMVARNLASRTEAGWAFIHGMLQESLIREASEGGRLEAQRAMGMTALWKSGRSTLRNRRLAHAETLLRRAAALADDATQRAKIRLSLAGVLFHQGHLTRALDICEESLNTHRSLGDSHNAARALLTVAGIEAQTSPERARSRLTDALRTFALKKDHRGEATTLECIGGVDVRTGRLKDARKILERALELRRQSGRQSEAGVNQSRLGLVAWLDGRMHDAREHYEAALSIHRATGNRPSEAVALGNYGVLNRYEGRLDEALRQFQQAASIHREIGNAPSESQVMTNLAELYVATGDLDEASEKQAAAIELARSIDDPGLCGAATQVLGVIRAKQGEASAARRHFIEAEALLGQSTDLIVLATTLCLRGRFEADQGDVAAARRALRKAVALDLCIAPSSELGNHLSELRKVAR